MRGANGWWIIVSVLCVTAAIAVSPAVAQLNIPGLGVDSGPAGPQGPKLFVTSYFTLPAEKQPAMLHIHAEIEPGHYIYSISQKPGGPHTTRIKLADSPHFRLAGEFKPSSPPKVSTQQDIWPGLPIEEHHGRVTWSVPIELIGDVDPQTLAITGAVNAQVCTKESCDLPEDFAFTAKVADLSAEEPAGPSFDGEFRAEASSIVISGHFEPKMVLPGGKARLVLTARPDPGYHVYALEDRDPGPGRPGKPTLIVLERSAGLEVQSPVPDVRPVTKATSLGGTQTFHKGPVAWTMEIDVPADAEPGSYPIAGIVGYQVCKDELCEPPRGVRFTADLQVGTSTTASAGALQFTPARYVEAAKLAMQRPVQFVASSAPGPAEPFDLAGLLWVLPFAFAGGLILNLMPCVLPVIGLKLFSFFEQAGHARSRVLALNLWFVFGLMLVFLILASLAAFLNLGWGEQFTHTWFKVAMTALVFAMALSFLGVWEIPIPGFVGHGKATELAAREGPSGAFWKGVMSTVLATPCSGPFLGPVFGFTLDKPPLATFAIFATVGLGMASPYLVIGAFPRLIAVLSWLKPGPWMETFKQVMGFVLLGTVVFLFSTINSDFFLATLTLMFAIWFACWWIGRTSPYAPPGKKALAWSGSFATAALIGYLGFFLFAPSASQLPWQPYSEAALAQAREEGKTVLIDFTADWCLTCKTNLKFAINTPNVRDLVDRHDVVPLLADWTDYSEEIKSKLARLGSRSIPLLAVYPAGSPDDAVIVLRDLLTEGDVLGALKEAGPSQSAGSAVAGSQPSPSSARSKLSPTLPATAAAVATAGD